MNVRIKDSAPAVEPGRFNASEMGFSRLVSEVKTKVDIELAGCNVQLKNAVVESIVSSLILKM